MLLIWHLSGTWSHIVSVSCDTHVTVFFKNVIVRHLKITGGHDAMLNPANEKLFKKITGHKSPYLRELLEH